MHFVNGTSRRAHVRAGLAAALATLGAAFGTACVDGNAVAPNPTIAGATSASSAAPAVVIPPPPSSGAKVCNAFAVTLPNGRRLSGKQKITLNQGINGVATVQGTRVRFLVDLNTFEVRDYTLTGNNTGVPVADRIVTGPTRIFVRKTPLHNQRLTSPMDLDLNNEQLVLERTSTNGTLDMKIQAKDCHQGGIFQMEPESDVVATTLFEHVLDPAFQYFDPASATSRTFFTNSGSGGRLLGYDSPQLATRVFPALGANVTGTVARYRVQNGGRMGMVVGEDAHEGLLTP